MSKSTAVKLVYTTQWTALHRVKAGDRIEHDGKVFRLFRFLPMARPHKPLGCVALAVPYDGLGNPLDESVALCFNDANELVRLVCGAVAVAEVKP